MSWNRAIERAAKLNSHTSLYSNIVSLHLGTFRLGKINGTINDKSCSMSSSHSSNRFLALLSNVLSISAVYLRSQIFFQHSGNLRAHFHVSAASLAVPSGTAAASVSPQDDPFLTEQCTDSGRCPAVLLPNTLVSANRRRGTKVYIAHTWISVSVKT